MTPGTPWAFNVSVAASLLLIAGGLHLWGAAEVRANPGEIIFLTFLGAVWLVIATKLFSFLGLSFRDDVVERKNTLVLSAGNEIQYLEGNRFPGGAARR